MIETGNTQNVVKLPENIAAELSSISHHTNPSTYGSKINEWVSTLTNLGMTDTQAKVLTCCSIYECSLKTNVKNDIEYYGKKGAAKGTLGWNCGEGAVQWTFWQYKQPLIKKFNQDSRSKTKLPTDWGTYSATGPRIVDLGLSDALLLVMIHYQGILGKTKNADIAEITAEFYLQKAGRGGSAKGKKTAVEAAYYRAQDYCKTHANQGSNASNQENGYLKTLKSAMILTGITDIQTFEGNTYAANVENYNGSSGGSGGSGGSYTPSTVRTGNGQSNKVTMLSAANTKYKDTKSFTDDSRRQKFDQLADSLINNSAPCGRTIAKSAEMYDSNILRGDQSSKNAVGVPPKKETKKEMA